MLPPEVTATDTTALLVAAVGGTVHDINAKFVTVGFEHTLPSTVTVAVDEKPVPVTFNV